MGSPGGSDNEESTYNTGDPGLIPGTERPPEEGNGYPLQYFAWSIPWTEEMSGPFCHNELDTTELSN